MSVEKATKMGFCFGVRRALRLLHEAAREHGSVETLGSVVHNRQAVESLEQLGVRRLENLEQAYMLPAADSRQMSPDGSGLTAMTTVLEILTNPSRP